MLEIKEIHWVVHERNASHTYIQTEGQNEKWTNKTNFLGILSAEPKAQQYSGKSFIFLS